MRRFLKTQSWKTKTKWAAIPGITGVGILYLLPGIAVLYYMVIDNVFQKKFVGLGNVIQILENPYFQLALRNTVRILTLCLAVTLSLSLALSLPGALLGKRWMLVGLLLILPFFMPTVLSAELWRGAMETLPPQMLLAGLFAWRNTGAVFLVLQIGCFSVEPEVMDAARVDGANRGQLFRYLLLPQLPPYLGISTVFLVMQYFGIFREAYLLFDTSYPPNEVYLLQHYMYNHFHKLNYPLLSASTFLFTLFLIGAMAVGVVAVNGIREKKERIGAARSRKGGG